MRILLITYTNPPPPANNMSGLYRRFSMFVNALVSIGEVQIIHYAAGEWFELNSINEAVHEFRSDHWGTQVSITAAPRRKPLSDFKSDALALFIPRFFFSLNGPLQVAALEARLDNEPDLIFVHRLASMAPIFQLRHRRMPPILFDLDDVEHWTKIRTALNAPSPLRKLIKLHEAPSILFAEQRATMISARTFVCSEQDRRYLTRLGMGKNLAVIPNAVSLPLAPQPIALEQTILFLGIYDYPPNAEAAERLISRIWPLVRRRIPGARLLIAGKSPEHIPSFHLRPPQVEFTGFVDDLDALYSRSRLICCPLTNGGGTRMKLIEAASRAKPIVSTAIGAEGLAFEDGIDILIRDDDESITEACICLLNDETLCTRVGQAAQGKVRRLYDLKSVQARIVATATDIVAANYSEMDQGRQNSGVPSA
jgi:glycosyltransferase involved in cell wall biosynthesis